MKSKWLKIIAVATCFFFTTNEVARAGIVSSITSSDPDVDSIQKRILALDNIQIPSELGELAKKFQGGSEQVLVIIQDAHANYEAQRNIAGIINHLASRNGLKLVNVEGAEGMIYNKFLSAYPNKEARRIITDHFMKQAKLTGPEYAVIVDQPELKLYGVEDESLYQENRKIFLEALDFKTKDEEILAQMRQLIEATAKKVFSKELFDLIKQSETFKRENKNLLTFLSFLETLSAKHSIDLNAYGQVSQFLALDKLHRSIDQTLLEREGEKIKALLIEKGLKEETFKNTDMAAVLVLARQSGLDLTSFVQIQLFIQSLAIQSKISVDLFDEIDRLDQVLREKLFEGEKDRILEGLFKILEIYEKIFDFSLSRDDADFFFKKHDEFKVETFKKTLSNFPEALEWEGGFPKGMEQLDTDLPRIEKFYQIALKRDHVLIEKTLSQFQANGSEVMALIAGGFHTAGFQRSLEEKGISYITVRPAITKLMDHDEQNRLYEASLRQEPETFANLLVKSYFRDKSSSINDPHYQLSAHKLLLDEPSLKILRDQMGKIFYTDLPQIINDYPQIGANIVLALLTVLQDIKLNPTTFDLDKTQAELKKLLPSGIDAQMRDFFYERFGVLKAGTRIYQTRQDELIVLADPDSSTPSIAATMYDVKKGKMGNGAELSRLKREGAGLYTLETALDENSRMVLQVLDGFQKGLVSLKGQLINSSTPLRAASLGMEEIAALKGKLDEAVSKVETANQDLTEQLLALKAVVEKANNGDYSEYDAITLNISGKVTALEQATQEADALRDSVKAQKVDELIQYADQKFKTIDGKIKPRTALLNEFTRDFFEVRKLIEEANGILTSLNGDPKANSADRKKLQDADEKLTKARDLLVAIDTKINKLPSSSFMKFIKLILSFFSGGRKLLRTQYVSAGEKYNAAVKALTVEKQKRIAQIQTLIEKKKIGEALNAIWDGLRKVSKAVRTPAEIKQELAELGKLSKILDDHRQDARELKPEEKEVGPLKGSDFQKRLKLEKQPTPGDLDAFDVQKAIKEVIEAAVSEERAITAGIALKRTVEVEQSGERWVVLRPLKISSKGTEEEPLTSRLAGYVIKVSREGKISSEVAKEGRRVANNELDTDTRAETYEFPPLENISVDVQQELKIGKTAEVILQRAAPYTLSKALEDIWKPKPLVKGVRTKLSPTERAEREELSRKVLEDWISRQYEEWRQGVDLDSKIKNSALFQMEEDTLQVRNIDHDELVGMNAIGKMSKKDFYQFFHYFWLVQVDIFSRYDDKINKQLGNPAGAPKESILEKAFHELLKQKGIFPTFYNALEENGKTPIKRAFDAFGENVRLLIEIEGKRKGLKVIEEKAKAEKQYTPLTRELILPPEHKALLAEIRQLEKQQRMARLRAEEILSLYGIQDDFEKSVRDRHKEEITEIIAEKDVARYSDFLARQVRTKELALRTLRQIMETKTWTSARLEEVDEILVALEKNLSDRNYLRPIVSQARKLFDPIYSGFLKKDLSERLVGVKGKAAVKKPYFLEDVQDAKNEEDTMVLETQINKMSELVLRYPKVLGELASPVQQGVASLLVKAELLKLREQVTKYGEAVDKAGADEAQLRTVEAEGVIVQKAINEFSKTEWVPYYKNLTVGIGLSANVKQDFSVIVEKLKSEAVAIQKTMRANEDRRLAKLKDISDKKFETTARERLAYILGQSGKLTAATDPKTTVARANQVYVVMKALSEFKLQMRAAQDKRKISLVELISEAQTIEFDFIKSELDGLIKKRHDLVVSNVIFLSDTPRDLTVMEMIKGLDAWLVELSQNAPGLKSKIENYIEQVVRADLRSRERNERRFQIKLDSLTVALDSEFFLKEEDLEAPVAELNELKKQMVAGSRFEAQIDLIEKMIGIRRSLLGLQFQPVSDAELQVREQTLNGLKDELKRALNTIGDNASKFQELSKSLDYSINEIKKKRQVLADAKVLETLNQELETITVKENLGKVDTETALVKFVGAINDRIVQVRSENRFNGKTFIQNLEGVIDRSRPFQIKNWAEINDPALASKKSKYTIAQLQEIKQKAEKFIQEIAEMALLADDAAYYNEKLPSLLKKVNIRLNFLQLEKKIENLKRSDTYAKLLPLDQIKNEDIADERQKLKTLAGELKPFQGSGYGGFFKDDSLRLDSILGELDQSLDSRENALAWSERINSEALSTAKVKLVRAEMSDDSVRETLRSIAGDYFPLLSKQLDERQMLIDEKRREFEKVKSGYGIQIKEFLELIQAVSGNTVPFPEMIKFVKENQEGIWKLYNVKRARPNVLPESFEQLHKVWGDFIEAFFEKQIDIQQEAMQRKITLAQKEAKRPDGAPQKLQNIDRLQSEFKEIEAKIDRIGANYDRAKAMLDLEAGAAKKAVVPEEKKVAAGASSMGQENPLSERMKRLKGQLGGVTGDLDSMKKTVEKRGNIERAKQIAARVGAIRKQLDDKEASKGLGKGDFENLQVELTEIKTELSEIPELYKDGNPIPSAQGVLNKIEKLQAEITERLEVMTEAEDQAKKKTAAKKTAVAGKEAPAEEEIAAGEEGASETTAPKTPKRSKFMERMDDLAKRAKESPTYVKYLAGVGVLGLLIMMLVLMLTPAERPERPSEDKERPTEVVKVDGGVKKAPEVEREKEIKPEGPKKVGEPAPVPPDRPDIPLFQKQLDQKRIDIEKEKQRLQEDLARRENDVETNKEITLRYPAHADYVPADAAKLVTALALEIEKKKRDIKDLAPEVGKGKWDAKEKELELILQVDFLEGRLKAMQDYAVKFNAFAAKKKAIEGDPLIKAEDRKSSVIDEEIYWNLGLARERQVAREELTRMAKVAQLQLTVLRTEKLAAQLEDEGRNADAGILRKQIASDKRDLGKIQEELRQFRSEQDDRREEQALKTRIWNDPTLKTAIEKSQKYAVELHELQMKRLAAKADAGDTAAATKLAKIRDDEAKRAKDKTRREAYTTARDKLWSNFWANAGTAKEVAEKKKIYEEWEYIYMWRNFELGWQLKDADGDAVRQQTIQEQIIENRFGWDWSKVSRKLEVELMKKLSDGEAYYKIQEARMVAEVEFIEKWMKDNPVDPARKDVDTAVRTRLDTKKADFVKRLEVLRVRNEQWQARQEEGKKHIEKNFSERRLLMLQFEETWLTKKIPAIVHVDLKTELEKELIKTKNQLKDIRDQKILDEALREVETQYKDRRKEVSDKGLASTKSLYEIDQAWRALKIKQAMAQDNMRKLKELPKRDGAQEAELAALERELDLLRNWELDWSNRWRDTMLAFENAADIKAKPSDPVAVIRRKMLWQDEFGKRMKEVEAAVARKELVEDEARRLLGIPAPAAPRADILVSVETSEAFREAEPLRIVESIEAVPAKGLLYQFENDPTTGEGDAAFVAKFGKAPLGKIAIDKMKEFVKLMGMDADKGENAIFMEAGRFYSLEHWDYYYFSPMFKTRNLDGPRKLKQRVLFMEMRIQALKKLQKDLGRYAVLSEEDIARYRSVWGSGAIPENHLGMMEEAWGAQAEEEFRKGVNLPAVAKKKAEKMTATDRKISLSAVFGLLEEEHVIAEVDYWRIQLSQRRLQEMRNLLLGNASPFGWRDRVAILGMLRDFAIAEQSLSWAYQKGAGFGTPLFEQYYLARVKYLTEYTGFYFGVVDNAPLLEAQGIKVLVNADNIAMRLGYPNFENLLLRFNAALDVAHRTNPYMDIQFIRYAEDMRKILDKEANPKTPLTSLERFKLLRYENELKHYTQGKFPYHHPSSLRLLIWRQGHSFLEEEDIRKTAETEAKQLLQGLSGLAADMRVLAQPGIDGAQARLALALNERPGGERGISVPVIMDQLVQNLIQRIDNPIINQKKFEADLEYFRGQLQIKQPDMSKGAREEAAQSMLEFMIINKVSLTKAQILDQFVELNKAETGVRTFFELRKKDYGTIVFKEDRGVLTGDFNEFMPHFLNGTEEKIDDIQKLRVLRKMIESNKQAFPREDVARIDMFLSLIEEMELIVDEERPLAARNAALKRFNARIYPDALWAHMRGIGVTNSGPLEVELRRLLSPEKGADTRAARLKGLYKDLTRLIGGYVRRDVRSGLLGMQRDSALRGLPLITDGGGKRSVLNREKDKEKIREYVEFVTFGPDLKLLQKDIPIYQPAAKLNVTTSIRDSALLDRFYEEMSDRKIPLKSMIEILQIASGNPKTWVIEEVEVRPKVKEKRVIVPFQRDTWELHQLLLGEKEAKAFPADGWPRATEKQRRIFVGTMIAEAEQIAVFGDKDYRVKRDRLVAYLKTHEGEAKEALLAVNETMGTVRDAIRADGRTLKRIPPASYSEADPLVQGVTRALLTSAAEPGNKLKDEIKKLKLLGEIVKNQKHLGAALDSAPLFYKAILGDEKFVPSFDRKQLLNNRESLSLFLNYLMLGIDPAAIPEDPDALGPALAKALERWNTNTKKLATHLDRFPLDRAILLSSAFEEVRRKEGWAPAGPFDAKNGKYEVEADQRAFEKFQKELRNLHMGVYLSYVQRLIGSIEGTPDAPVVVPMPVVGGGFDGAFAVPVIDQPMLADLQAKKTAVLAKAEPQPKLKSNIMLATEYSSLKLPERAQNKDNAIVLLPYGHPDDRGVISSGVFVWNPDKKAYEKFAPKRDEKNAEKDEIKSLFGPKTIVAPGSKTLMEQQMLKDGDKPAGFVWKTRSADDRVFKDVLVLRGEDASLTLLGGQKLYLGTIGEKSEPMRVLSSGVRVDDAGELHGFAVLDGDRFAGIVQFDAVFDKTTEKVTVTVRSNFTAKDVAVLKGSDRHISFTRVDPNPASQSEVIFYTVNGPVTEKVVNIAPTTPAIDKTIGKQNETYGYTVKGKDTTFTVELLPVKGQTYDVRMLTKAVTAGEPSVQVTIGLPRTRPIAAGDEIISHYKITHGKTAPDVKAVPDGWPLADKAVKKGDVSGKAEQIKVAQERTEYVLKNKFNRETLLAADDFYLALYFPKAKGFDDPIVQDAMKAGRFSRLFEYLDKGFTELSKKDTKGEARLRAFISRSADIRAATHEEAWTAHLALQKDVVPLLRNADQRQTVIALRIFSDLVLRGDESPFAAKGEKDNRTAIAKTLLIEEKELAGVLAAAKKEKRNIVLADLIKKGPDAEAALVKLKRLAQDFENNLEANKTFEAWLIGDITSASKNWEDYVRTQFRSLMIELGRPVAMLDVEGREKDVLVDARQPVQVQQAGMFGAGPLSLLFLFGLVKTGTTEEDAEEEINDIDGWLKEQGIDIAQPSDAKLMEVALKQQGGTEVEGLDEMDLMEAWLKKRGVNVEPLSDDQIRAKIFDTLLLSEEKGDQSFEFPPLGELMRAYLEQRGFEFVMPNGEELQRVWLKKQGVAAESIADFELDEAVQMAAVRRWFQDNGKEKPVLSLEELKAWALKGKFQGTSEMEMRRGWLAEHLSRVNGLSDADVLAKISDVLMRVQARDSDADIKLPSDTELFRAWAEERNIPAPSYDELAREWAEENKKEIPAQAELLRAWADTNGTPVPSAEELQSLAGKEASLEDLDIVRSWLQLQSVKAPSDSDLLIQWASENKVKIPTEATLLENYLGKQLKTELPGDKELAQMMSDLVMRNWFVQHPGAEPFLPTPVELIHTWAEAKGIELLSSVDLIRNWAARNDVEIPSDEDLLKMWLEDYWLEQKWHTDNPSPEAPSDGELNAWLGTQSFTVPADSTLLNTWLAGHGVAVPDDVQDIRDWAQTQGFGAALPSEQKLLRDWAMEAWQKENRSEMPLDLNLKDWFEKQKSKLPSSVGLLLEWLKSRGKTIPKDLVKEKDLTNPRKEALVFKTIADWAEQKTDAGKVPSVAELGEFWSARQGEKIPSLAELQEWFKAKNEDLPTSQELVKTWVEEEGKQTIEDRQLLKDLLDERGIGFPTEEELRRTWLKTQGVDTSRIPDIKLSQAIRDLRMREWLQESGVTPSLPSNEDMFRAWLEMNKNPQTPKVKTLSDPEVLDAARLIRMRTWLEDQDYDTSTYADGELEDYVRRVRITNWAEQKGLNVEEISYAEMARLFSKEVLKVEVPSPADLAKSWLSEHAEEKTAPSEFELMRKWLSEQGVDHSTIENEDLEEAMVEKGLLMSAWFFTQVDKQDVPYDKDLLRVWLETEGIDTKVLTDDQLAEKVSGMRMRIWLEEQGVTTKAASDEELMRDWLDEKGLDVESLPLEALPEQIHYAKLRDWFESHGIDHSEIPESLLLRAYFTELDLPDIDDLSETDLMRKWLEVKEPKLSTEVSDADLAENVYAVQVKEVLKEMRGRKETRQDMTDEELYSKIRETLMRNALEAQGQETIGLLSDEELMRAWLELKGISTKDVADEKLIGLVRDEEKRVWLKERQGIDAEKISAEQMNEIIRKINIREWISRQGVQPEGFELSELIQQVRDIVRYKGAIESLEQEQPLSLLLQESQSGVASLLDQSERQKRIDTFSLIESALKEIPYYNENLVRQSRLVRVGMISIYDYVQNVIVMFARLQADEAHRLLSTETIANIKQNITHEKLVDLMAWVQQERLERPAFDPLSSQVPTALDHLNQTVSEQGLPLGEKVLPEVALEKREVVPGIIPEVSVAGMAASLGALPQPQKELLEALQSKDDTSRAQFLDAFTAKLTGVIATKEELALVAANDVSMPGLYALEWESSQTIENIQKLLNTLNKAQHIAISAAEIDEATLQQLMRLEAGAQGRLHVLQLSLGDTIREVNKTLKLDIKDSIQFSLAPNVARESVSIQTASRTAVPYVAGRIVVFGEERVGFIQQEVSITLEDIAEALKVAKEAEAAIARAA